MGDFRASIKIKFELGDVCEEADMSINWWAEEDTGVDRRVTEWIASVAAKGERSVREGIANYFEEAAEKQRVERIRWLKKELDILENPDD